MRDYTLQNDTGQSSTSDLCSEYGKELFQTVCTNDQRIVVLTVWPVMVYQYD